MNTQYRGVNSYPKLVGRVVIRHAKTWAGNYPLCPPIIDAPAVYRIFSNWYCFERMIR